MSTVIRSLRTDLGSIMAVVDMVDGNVLRVVHTEPLDPDDRESAEAAFVACLEAEVRHLIALRHPSAQPSIPSTAGDGTVEPAALRVGPRRPAPVPARIDWPVVGTWAVITAASSAWVACIAITAHAVWKAVWG